MARDLVSEATRLANRKDSELINNGKPQMEYIEENDNSWVHA